MPFLFVFWLPCRAEIYCGKKVLNDGPTDSDAQTGPQAVVRNLSLYFSNRTYKGRRLVVMDRYHTSIAVSQQLKNMGIRSIGTIKSNVLGWNTDIMYKFKTRPKSVPRATHRMARSKGNRDLVSFVWVDNRPVAFLANGVRMHQTTVRRRTKRCRGVESQSVVVPCPNGVR